MSVRLNSASAIWNAPIPRDTDTAQAPRKHRSKLKRSASRIADSPMAAPVSRSISPPRTMTLKFFRSRRALAIEIEFVAIVTERSGGIPLAKAKLGLPLSRNTVEVSETKVRAAKAKEVPLRKSAADGVGQQNFGDQLEIVRHSGFISRD